MDVTGGSTTDSDKIFPRRLESELGIKSGGTNDLGRRYFHQTGYCGKSRFRQKTPNPLDSLKHRNEPIRFDTKTLEDFRSSIFYFQGILNSDLIHRTYPFLGLMPG